MSGTAFLWGKLPAHGDFVVRGLAPLVRDRLDQWLAASLADAREALGGGFEEAYDQAPPWRFAWMEPQGWAAGAMAASIDSVGRRYPILVGMNGLTSTAVESVANGVEDLLYDALASRWDADALVTAAGAITPGEAEPWTYGVRWWTLTADEDEDRSVTGDYPPLLIRNMLMQDIGR